MTHHLSSDEASSSSGASSPLRIDGFGPPDVGNLTWNSVSSSDRANGLIMEADQVTT